ncbi:MAG TPA: beta-ketoacyl synthase chain length factor, partial [Paraburkholderia sp.]|nr:beta-ketoacyl synthase chain length factor [Paraburkholderia sp.]
MPDLHWTIPVARWSSWPAVAAVAPDLGFIEPMARRRLSTLSRIALKVAHDCAADKPSVRIVFASRHG